MMGTSSKRTTKEAAENAQAALTEPPLSMELCWQFLMLFAEYRMELPVKELMVFPNSSAYYVCPRCGITMEREFMAYCDRCGQHLGWRDYKKARTIYPGNWKERHT